MTLKPRMMRRKKTKPRAKRALEGNENPRSEAIQCKRFVRIDRSRKRLPITIHNKAYLSFKYLLRTRSKTRSRRRLDPMMVKRVNLVLIPCSP
jgi:hypothetical protein